MTSSIDIYGKRVRSEEDLPSQKYSRTDTSSVLNGREIIALGDLPSEVIARIISFLSQKAARAFSLTSIHNYAQTIAAVSSIFKDQMLSNLEILKKDVEWISKSKRFIQIVESQKETLPQKSLSLVYKKFPTDQLACLVNLTQIIDLTAWQMVWGPFLNAGIDWFNTFIYISILKKFLVLDNEYISQINHSHFNVKDPTAALVDASIYLNKENFFEIISWFIEFHHAIYSHTETKALPMAQAFSFIFTNLFQFLLENDELTLLSEIFDKFGIKIISMEIFNPGGQGMPLCIRHMTLDIIGTPQGGLSSKIEQFIKENEHEFSPLTKDLFKAGLISQVISNTTEALKFQTVLKKLTIFQSYNSTLSSSLIKDRCIESFVKLLTSFLILNNLKTDSEISFLTDNEIEDLLKICFHLINAITNAEAKNGSLKDMICLAKAIGRQIRL